MGPLTTKRAPAPDTASLSFEDFCRLRAQERAYAIANGFGEGDPEKNGELGTLRALLPLVSCFVDVGANNGLFIDAVADSVCRPYVLAFEPNPGLAAALGARSDCLVQKAVGDTQGRATFYLHPTDDTVSSLAPRGDLMPSFADRMQPTDVEVTTLDVYADQIRRHAGRGAFIKIDVEGHELAVMRGAAALLASLENAAVVFEFSTAWALAGYTVKEAFHLLDRAGFRVFRVLPLGLEHLRFYTPDMEQTGYCNYVAVKGIALDNILIKRSLPSATHVENAVYLF